MLLIHNVDRPGVIGMVGKVLGDQGINIVRMQCALGKAGRGCVADHRFRCGIPICGPGSDPFQLEYSVRQGRQPFVTILAIRLLWPLLLRCVGLLRGRSPCLREHSLVPVGMATILPEAARHVRHLEAELLAYCQSFRVRRDHPSDVRVSRCVGARPRTNAARELL